MKYFTLAGIKYGTLCLLMAAVAAGCASTQQNIPQNDSTPTDTTEKVRSPYEQDRPVPNPIDHEIPDSYKQAIERGSRTSSGAPGADYWQQHASYDMDVELIPEERKVTGSSTITYYNNSPDELKQLLLELAQNVHSEGVIRNETTEITGGITIEHIAVNGSKISEIQQQGQRGYLVQGTLLGILPEETIAPGDSATLDIAWSFPVPQQGAGGRMGYSRDNMFFIAYWYPQMRVYDDVVGWFTDQFKINAEFYHGFADYSVDITVPEQWLVNATGTLENGKEVLSDPIFNRMQKAHNSDEVINIISESDFGDITKPGSDGKVTWRFSAENIRDFAFSVTKESVWDATRASVGDLDNDGTTEHTNIDAVYRSSANLWQDAAGHSQHAIEFLSEFTGLSYPWPHMTAVEGGGIIGGGMEFPMITVIGAYTGQPTQSLYSVIAHELAHMWVPMQISTNERRYSWMDEGTTTFNENQSKRDIFPDQQNPDITDFQNYMQIAGTDFEGEIMRWSDYHYNSFAYSIASYPKPASMLVTLRGLLDEETFMEALQTFLSDWQYKHPYPWDLFNTFEEVSGRDLDWFWRSWYYETWTLDQAIASVEATENGTRITIEDRGLAPMPVYLTITTASGETITRTVDVETWLQGATETSLMIDSDNEVTQVEIDAEYLFPDVNRDNNSWKK